MADHFGSAQTADLAADGNWRSAGQAVEQAGWHASAFVTLTTYAHALPGLQQEAVERLDAALRPHLQG